MFSYLRLLITKILKGSTARTLFTKHPELSASFVTVICGIPATMLDRLGMYQVKSSSDTGAGNQINVTGYPDDEPAFTKWRALGNIPSISTYGNDAMYSHSADAWNGQSGSPNFNSPNGTDFYILGVESAEDSNWNYSCDITPTSITNINVWK